MGCDIKSFLHFSRPDISIHAPIVGCDVATVTSDVEKLKISIHAPIVGYDQVSCITGVLIWYFNPRTHRGVRHNRTMYVDSKDLNNFNPRTHRGVRQKHIFSILIQSKISIHAPIVGCDMLIDFHEKTYSIISIHAPIVGCDRWNKNQF